MRRGDPSVSPQNFTILARASFSNLASFFLAINEGSRGRGVERPPASRSCSIHLSEVFHCCLFYFSFFIFPVFHFPMAWANENRALNPLMGIYTFSMLCFLLGIFLVCQQCAPFATTPLALLCSASSWGRNALCQMLKVFPALAYRRFFYFFFFMQEKNSVLDFISPSVYLLCLRFYFHFFSFSFCFCFFFSLCFSDKTMRVFPALQPCEDIVFNLCFFFYW